MAVRLPYGQWARQKVTGGQQVSPRAVDQPSPGLRRDKGQPPLPVRRRVVGLDPIPLRGGSGYARDMPLLNVVLTLVVVGVVLWLINTYIPMQGTIKKIMNFVVVVAVIIWLLYGFGIINGGGDVHMPVVK